MEGNFLVCSRINYKSRIKNEENKSGMLAHSGNHRIQKAKAGESQIQDCSGLFRKVLRPVWAIEENPVEGKRYMDR